MAPTMIPPHTTPDFLTEVGWGGSQVLPLAGDASFRRYFRVVHPEHGRAVLMDAPPEHEDVRPFIAIAEHLDEQGLRAPRILARDLDRGLLLLEDFGDDRVGPVLAADASEERAIYAKAVGTLVELVDRPLPDGIEPYDEAALMREAMLFPEWYAPALSLEVDVEGFKGAWRQCWAGTCERTAKQPVLVLRDYHADNLMILEGEALGLLDFQDALAGHAAYDLVSLLQDARRDVDPALEEELLDRFMDKTGVANRDAFRADYALLGAQRNVKILGIFTRLWQRDGKDHYLKLLPRVWGLLERDLEHPLLAPVKSWFDVNVPLDKRAAAWEGR